MLLNFYRNNKIYSDNSGACYFTFVTKGGSDLGFSGPVNITISSIYILVVESNPVLDQPRR